MLSNYIHIRGFKFARYLFFIFFLNFTIMTNAKETLFFFYIAFFVSILCWYLWTKLFTVKLCFKILCLELNLHNLRKSYTNLTQTSHQPHSNSLQLVSPSLHRQCTFCKRFILVLTDTLVFRPMLCHWMWLKWVLNWVTTEGNMCMQPVAVPAEKLRNHLCIIILLSFMQN